MNIGPSKHCLMFYLHELQTWKVAFSSDTIAECEAEKARAIAEECIQPEMLKILDRDADHAAIWDHMRGRVRPFLKKRTEAEEIADALCGR